MRGKGCLFLLVMLTAIAGCMSTRFYDVWVDNTYQRGLISDVFVMAIFPSPERERMIEDEMARQFRSRGVHTVLSYAEFPGTQPNEDEIMSQSKKLGINAVLVTKFIKREYRFLTNPDNPYSATEAQPYAIIDTSLYDVKTKKKIWSASSATWIIGLDSRLNSSFVSAVLNKLADDKFIK